MWMSIMSSGYTNDLLYDTICLKLNEIDMHDYFSDGFCTGNISISTAESTAQSSTTSSISHRVSATQSTSQKNSFSQSPSPSLPTQPLSLSLTASALTTSTTAATGSLTQHISSASPTYRDFMEKKNSLQLNLISLRSSNGIRFAGIPMTREKTIAVGSFIFTIISLIILRLN